ncbi:MAG: site-specific integrase [Candidatus Bathyarchaeota archaeon]|nr:site-specific integrase [Candidatus Bathyarchaeota archaeon]
MGSNPTPCTFIEPTAVFCNAKLVEFGVWLLRKGNRESTVQRKLKYLKELKGSPEQMFAQVLAKDWSDKSKECALEAVRQYAEFLGVSVKKPKFRAYDNRELYVPNPLMVKQFLYRVRNLQLRASILIAIETGASASEVWRLTWRDVNLQGRTLTVTGVKGHRTWTYPISNELTTLLLQLPKDGERIFKFKTPRYLNDALWRYKQILARETGNSDFLKIHFHTFRHFAISWRYFKTKDIVETQRFARHCNIQNTLRYVHIVKAWVRENEFEVVYADSKEELTKYLSEGYELVAKTEWGYCLRKPKMLLS